MTSTTTATTLSPGTLALAVADCVMGRMDADATCAALPREDPAIVRQKHATIGARRERDLLRYGPAEDHARTLPQRRVGVLPGRNRHGLTLRDIAEQTGVARATLKAAMIHHGYLEEVPYGRQQRRTLVTLAAFRAGLGHTADPSDTHSPTLGGWERAAPFPVFYPDRLDDIMWTIGLDRVEASCADLPTKQTRLAWLLSHHAYLPNDELHRLSGMSQRSVDAAAAKARAASA